MKKLRNIKHSNEAVAGVVVAMLLLGLIFSMIGLIQGVYVPQWSEKKEAEHMGEVANQFTQLKFAIDTLSVQGQPYISISSPITLGSKEMPFLISSRAYGDINILPEAFKLTLNNSDDEEEIHLGAIKYSSSNAYYIDKSYIYENGALILSQTKGNIMIVNPQFIVVNDNELVFNLVKIKAIGEKTSVSGYGTCPIQTEFSKSYRVPIDYVEKITIITESKEAWKKFIQDTLPDNDNDQLNYTITETTNGTGIEITFIEDSTAGTLYPRIYSNIVEIDVKFSQAWS